MTCTNSDDGYKKFPSVRKASLLDRVRLYLYFTYLLSCGSLHQTNSCPCNKILLLITVPLSTFLFTLVYSFIFHPQYYPYSKAPTLPLQLFHFSPIIFFDFHSISDSLQYRMRLTDILFSFASNIKDFSKRVLQKDQFQLQTNFFYPTPKTGFWVYYGMLVNRLPCLQPQEIL